MAQTVTQFIFGVAPIYSTSGMLIWWGCVYAVCEDMYAVKFGWAFFYFKVRLTIKDLLDGFQAPSVVSSISFVTAGIPTRGCYTHVGDGFNHPQYVHKFMFTERSAFKWCSQDVA